jgi:hypothetical protein
MATKGKTETDTFGVGDWMKSVSEFWQTSLGQAKSYDQTEAMEQVKALQADMLAFVDARIEKDLAAVKRLGEAKTPADFGRVQLEYLQDLMVDYNRQAMKAAEEAGKAMMTAVHRLPKGL